MDSLVVYINAGTGTLFSHNFFIFPTKNRVFVIFLHYLHYSFIVFMLIILTFLNISQKSVPVPAFIYTILT